MAGKAFSCRRCRKNRVEWATGTEGFDKFAAAGRESGGVVVFLKNETQPVKAVCPVALPSFQARKRKKTDMKLTSKPLAGRRALQICLCGIAVSPLGARELPNVICILADDLGYCDLGCYGARNISTPALDALAAEGVRFTQAYAPASTSSPSRYALLTGEYAWRKKVGIMPADAPLCIGSGQTTWPKVMKQLGYATALVGKWHLGLGSADEKVDFNRTIRMGPPDVGFDYCYYFPATNDRVPCVYIENDRVDGLDPDDPIEVSYRKKVGSRPTGKEHPELLSMPYHLGHDGTIVNGISRIGWMSGGEKALWKDEEMAGRLLEKAREYVKKHKDRPFFLYYATHNAHEPRVPSRRFRGTSRAGVYGDVIQEFDYCVGELVRTLKEEGIYDNTIIIVTSDNAPMIKEGYQDGALENMNGHDPYGRLRGEKYSLHEGGHRVPFIYSWPQGVKHPFVQEQPFLYLDLMATVPALIGHPLPAGQCADSRDGSRLFRQRQAPLYRDFILTQNNGGEVSMRMGRWKLIPAGSGRGTELYDLRSDPSELHNLLFAYPDTVAKMNALLKEGLRQ